MRDAKVLDTAHVVRNLVKRKGDGVLRAEELTGCDELEKRLFSSIKVRRITTILDQGVGF